MQAAQIPIHKQQNCILAAILLPKSEVSEQGLKLKLTITQNTNQTAGKQESNSKIRIYETVIQTLVQYDKICQECDNLQQFLQYMQQPGNLQIDCNLKQQTKKVNVTVVGKSRLGKKTVKLATIALPLLQLVQNIKQDRMQWQQLIQQILTQCMNKGELNPEVIRKILENIAIVLQSQIKQQQSNRKEIKQLQSIKQKVQELEQFQQKQREQEKNKVKKLEDQLASTKKQLQQLQDSFKQMQRIIADMKHMKQNNTLATNSQILTQSSKLQHSKKQPNQSEVISKDKTLQIYSLSQRNSPLFVQKNKKLVYSPQKCGWAQFVFNSPIPKQNTNKISGSSPKKGEIKPYRFAIRVSECNRQDIWVSMGIINWEKRKDQLNTFSRESSCMQTYGSHSIIYPGEIRCQECYKIGQIMEITVNMQEQTITWSVAGRLLGQTSICRISQIYYPYVNVFYPGTAIQWIQ